MEYLDHEYDWPPPGPNSWPPALKRSSIFSPLKTWLKAQALPVRCALLGALTLGMIGAIVGLVVGLIVHPPTAAFALIEIGMPGTLTGALVGLVSGSLLNAMKHVRDIKHR